MGRIENFKYILILAVFLVAPVALADTEEREVVVTADRISMPRKRVASSVTVITEKEIEESKKTSMLELLAETPGVDVVRSGGPGGNTSVFIRGANAEHTLVMIDGVEANNPIGNARGFSFADITLDNIERIEILRGPQSTLYGSDAMGGVIAIFTKTGKGPFSGYASAEAGSYNTFIEKTGFSGSTDEVNYSFGYSRQDIHGVSSAAFRDGNQEGDAYGNNSFSTKVGITPSEIFSGNVTLRYNDAKSDIDNFGGVGGDDPNRKVDNEQLFARGEGRLKLFSGSLEQIFGVSLNDQELEDNDDPDIDHPSDILRSNFEGRSVKVDLQNNVTVSEEVKIIVGLETEEEQGDSHYFSDGFFGPFESNLTDKEIRTNGYYTQAIVGPFSDFSTALGIRVDDNSKFGSEVTWRVAPTYLIESTGTKLNATAGTGFKTPSIFQLFSEFGRPDLAPEESLGFDGGFEQSLIGDDLVFGATYFWNDFDNLINFDPNTFIFENISEARTSGIEAFIRAQVAKNLSVGLDYTFTDAEDRDTGLDLLRRARHKFGGDVNYSFLERANLSLNIHYVGESEDNDFSTFPATRTELSGFTLVDVAVSYRLNDHVELFTRLDNLFDEEYEQVLGFGTMGMAAYGGVKVSL